MKSGEWVIAAAVVLPSTLSITPASASVTYLPGAYESASGSGSYRFSSSPAPSAYAYGPPGKFEFANLQYFFEVTGPQNAAATIDISAFIQATETLTGPGIAYFYGNLPQYDEYAALSIGLGPFYSGGSYFLEAGIGARGFRNIETNVTSVPVQTVSYFGQSVRQVSTLHIHQTISVPTNAILDIELYSAVGGSYDSPPILTSVGSAFVDPVLALDRSFAMANPGYSLVISPGVGNLSAVPEPVAWLMILSGFGTIGAIMRNRRHLAERQCVKSAGSGR